MAGVDGLCGFWLLLVRLVGYAWSWLVMDGWDLGAVMVGSVSLLGGGGKIGSGLYCATVGSGCLWLPMNGLRLPMLCCGWLPRLWLAMASCGCFWLPLLLVGCGVGCFRVF